MKSRKSSSASTVVWVCAASFFVASILFCGTSTAAAQQAAPVASGAVPSAVPSLISYNGVLGDSGGQSRAAVTGVTFLLYRDEQGGAPLWIETQNVTPDKTGHYVVQLGATSANGLPADLFRNGEPRWLAVQVAGEAEQPRVLLVAVPYAMKAADAATLGGLPPSAFVLAAPPAAVGSADSTPGQTTADTAPPPTSVSGAGTTDYLPLWTSSSVLGTSAVFQTGSGSTARIGINSVTPAATLDVNGGVTVRGLLNLPPAGTAKASGGVDSRPFGLVAETYNSGTKTTANQAFHWQAEPVGNNTASPSASLNLLFATAPATAAETGLAIASNGRITFAPGQVFPGTGPGTITGITAGTDLTGGGASGGVTLKLDTTKVPQLAAANTFTGNQTVDGNLSATGVLSGSGFQIGSNLFGYGSYNSQNVLLGFAGNTTMTGGYNTAGGYHSLYSITTSSENTAFGDLALLLNTSGGSNTAVGFEALSSNTTANYNTGLGYDAVAYNTTGYFNTGSGSFALIDNTTGHDNTSDGAQALLHNTTGIENTVVGSLAAFTNVTGSQITCMGYECDSTDNLHNATAIGSHAFVGISDAVVLGSVAGVNGATATARVGIGTTTPTNILTIAQGAGHPVSDSWETYSSRRWKTNIHTLPNALAKVEQLRGVSYDMKDSGKHEVGVIAEEVGAVVPELVTYEANGKDARSVDYARLTALLIEAVKQQQKQIRKQSALVQKQSVAIRQLKSQLLATRQALAKTQAQINAGPWELALAAK